MALTKEKITEFKTKQVLVCLIHNSEEEILHALVWCHNRYSVWPDEIHVTSLVPKMDEKRVNNYINNSISVFIQCGKYLSRTSVGYKVPRFVYHFNDITLVKRIAIDEVQSLHSKIWENYETSLENWLSEYDPILIQEGLVDIEALKLDHYFINAFDYAELTNMLDSFERDFNKSLKKFKLAQRCFHQEGFENLNRLLFTLTSGKTCIGSLNRNNIFTKGMRVKSLDNINDNLSKLNSTFSHVHKLDSGRWEVHMDDSSVHFCPVNLSKEETEHDRLMFVGERKKDDLKFVFGRYMREHDSFNWLLTDNTTLNLSPNEPKPEVPLFMGYLHFEFESVEFTPKNIPRKIIHHVKDTTNDCDIKVTEKKGDDTQVYTTDLKVTIKSDQKHQLKPKCYLTISYSGSEIASVKDKKFEIGLKSAAYLHAWLKQKKPIFARENEQLAKDKVESFIYLLSGKKKRLFSFTGYNLYEKAHKAIEEMELPRSMSNIFCGRSNDKGLLFGNTEDKDKTNVRKELTALLVEKNNLPASIVNAILPTFIKSEDKGEGERRSKRASILPVSLYKKPR